MVWGNARKFRLARIGQAAAKVVAWKMCQCTLNPCHLTAKSRGICAFLKSIASNTAAKPSIAPFRCQEDPLVSSIMKATKQALERGSKYKEALRTQKTASSSSKWKPPKIPLTTPVGVEDMTLQDMMKKEKLSYADAVTVYLAFQDSLKKSSKKPSKTEKANTNSSGESAAPAEADEPQPKRKKTKAEADKKSGKQPPAEEAGKKSRKQPPAEEAGQKSGKKPPAKEADKKSGKQPPSEAPVDSVDAGKSNSVAPKAKASKAKAPPPLKRKGAFLHEPEAEVLEPPPKRVRGKTHAANQIPEDTEADQIPEDAEADQIPEDAEADQIPEDPVLQDWDELCYEYELWRQGLPQASELEADARAHRASAPLQAVKSVSATAATVPGMGTQLALPAAEPTHGDANDSQVCFDCNVYMILNFGCDQIHMHNWV